MNQLSGSIEGLSVQYRSIHVPLKRAAVSEVSITLDDHGLIALCGPNGCGKSTLLKAIAGLFNSDESVNVTGAIFFNSSFLNSSVTHKKINVLALSHKEAARLIAYVPGRVSTTASITVLDFVLQARFSHQTLLHRKPYRKPYRDDESDTILATNSLDLIGALYLQNKLICELSTGELQLSLIARALTQEPKLLLIDESLSNLDLQHQAKVVGELKSISKKIPVMLATHDLNLAARFSDKVILMNRGKIIVQGKTESIFNEENIKKTFFSHVEMSELDHVFLSAVFPFKL